MEKRSPLLLLNAVALLLLFIFLTNDPKHQTTAQIFCRSQFNLANEACSVNLFPGVDPTPTASGDHELPDSHNHSRRHHMYGDPFDTPCCRRLMGLDNSCICQVMAYLPRFITRVKHAMTLIPLPGCDVSFECLAPN